MSSKVPRVTSPDSPARRLEAITDHAVQLLDLLDRSGSSPDHLLDDGALGPICSEDATILFLDLESFTQWVCREEPTTVVDTLNRFFATCDDIFHQYDLTVSQYLGDGLMAFARGRRHALRAVQAAQLINDRLDDAPPSSSAAADRTLQVRIGISSGPVMFSRIGTKNHSTITAVGRPTILAARLQQAATPGSICICSQTQAELKSQVAVGPRVLVNFKGLEDPTWLFNVRRSREIGQRA